MSDDVSFLSYSNAKAETNTDPGHINPRSITKPLSKNIQIFDWDMLQSMDKTNIRKEIKMSKNVHNEIIPSKRMKAHHFIRISWPKLNTLKEESNGRFLHSMGVQPPVDGLVCEH